MMTTTGRLVVSLTVTVDAETNTTTNYTFTPANTATATGGTGLYSYQWVVTGTVGGGSWGFSAATSATTSINVTGAPLGVSSATLACDVTDVGTGLTTRSPIASYEYERV